VNEKKGNQISPQFKKLLAEYAYEIRNGKAHRAAEEEMLRNCKGVANGKRN